MHDIITEIHHYIHRSKDKHINIPYILLLFTVEFPAKVRMSLLNKMADIE